jgi:hypothetical protein
MLEKLDGPAAVKGTMLTAHLEWAKERLGDLEKALGPHLSIESAAALQHFVLATEWFPFRTLIEIDSAIAQAVGGAPEQTYGELGRHSANVNLLNVYKGFVSTEPHRFFERSTLLHDRFQNFGKASYQKVNERAGKIRMEGYTCYSPVYCATAKGYFDEALRLMHAPGPISVVESSCICAGQPACVFDLSW